MITVIPRKIAATSVNGVAVANDGSITLPVDSTPTSNSTNLVTSGGVKTELDALTTRLAGKQDALTFDSAHQRQHQPGDEGGCMPRSAWLGISTCRSKSATFCITGTPHEIKILNN